MYYKIFVKNLSERIFHIAVREADSRDFVLRQTGMVDSTSILVLSCDDVHYLTHLADTLETDSKVQVLAIKDTYDRLIDYKNISHEFGQTFFNRYTLSLDTEPGATIYA